MVRLPVLRPGKPIEECAFQGDNDPSTLHLGAYLSSHLIGVASFMQNKNDLFKAPIQYQLRGMAILPDFQQQNIGTELLLAGETILKRDFGATFLWFNARESAVGFYKKFGYSTKGEPFMIPNVCRHIMMYKNLSYI